MANSPTKQIPSHWPVLIDGRWLNAADLDTSPLVVNNPFSGQPIGEVPKCGPKEVDAAVAAAKRALSEEWPQFERATVLDRAAVLIDERIENLARTICIEAAKPIRTARLEAQRGASTLRFCAAECRKLAGEMVPMDASAAGAGRIGFALRMPIGVVAAISPFNFPLNLVAHKLGPAIAAGAPVVLKPASATPLSAINLAKILVEAGVPDGFINVVTGPGGAVGDYLVTHPDIQYVTFTGSAAVGWAIPARSPKKKVSLELGSNSPLIIDATGDYEKAAHRAAFGAFAHGGQSCISTQRIYVHESIEPQFLASFLEQVQALKVGDPEDESTDVSQLITMGERDRVVAWIEEATQQGAKVLAGGELDNDTGVLMPTVLSQVDPTAKVHCQEVFGPLVTVTTFESLDDAIRMANDSELGLQAGLFTGELGHALKAARKLEFGGVIINDVPTFRADQQPYGGIKDSGNTREGPAYAIAEMTELRFVSLS